MLPPANDLANPYFTNSHQLVSESRIQGMSMLDLQKKTPAAAIFGPASIWASKSLWSADQLVSREELVQCHV